MNAVPTSLIVVCGYLLGVVRSLHIQFRTYFCVQVLKILCLCLQGIRPASHRRLDTLGTQLNFSLLFSVVRATFSYVGFSPCLALEPSFVTVDRARGKRTWEIVTRRWLYLISCWLRSCVVNNVSVHTEISTTEWTRWQSRVFKLPDCKSHDSTCQKPNFLRYVAKASLFR